MTEQNLLTLIQEYFDEMIEESEFLSFPRNYEDCCQELVARIKAKKTSETNY